MAALQKKFQIVEKDAGGKEVLRSIQMEKAGLLYDLVKWQVTRGIMMEQ
jgi:hypothetical protein